MQGRAACRADPQVITVSSGKEAPVVAPGDWTPLVLHGAPRPNLAAEG